MNSLQKGSILTLLKTDEMSSNYTNNYWFSYKDYLDPADDFTDFCCECFEGKHEYIALIENLINKDKTAKIFVQVYGLDNKDKVITADTLIIFSKLSLVEIKQIFNEPKDIFPSDIGEEPNMNRAGRIFYTSILKNSFYCVTFQKSTTLSGLCFC